MVACNGSQRLSQVVLSRPACLHSSEGVRACEFEKREQYAFDVQMSHVEVNVRFVEALTSRMSSLGEKNLLVYSMICDLTCLVSAKTDADMADMDVASVRVACRDNVMGKLGSCSVSRNI